MKSTPGIIGAGNWIVDTTKIIDVYPAQDTLANISSEKKNNGGGAFNVLVDLARLGADFPLYGLGLIGNDVDGDWVMEQCRAYGIKADFLSRHPEAHTSYTDVMTVISTGRRTFFHQRGANRFLGPEHFPWEKLQGRILYLGYLLLLDTIDSPDPVHGTIGAGILKRAGEEGFYRVVDLVSVERPDYSGIVNPCLPHIDLLICNELEASRVTGVPISAHNASLFGEELREMARILLNRGVQDWVVIHMPEGAYACSAKGGEIRQGRVKLPKQEIVGAAGAGDAFAAGLLFGLHNHQSMPDNLLFGVCTAAACMRAATTSDGVATLEECLALGKKYGFLDTN